MCGRALGKQPYTLENVPDWFVAPKMLEDFDSGEDLESDEEHDSNDDLDELITWRNYFKQRKAQKLHSKKS